MRDHPHPRKPHVKEGGVRMENKTKILTFAAVALMFAVCFIGFTAINDGGVDADDSATTVDKGPLDGKCTIVRDMTYADGVYTLTGNVTVALTDNVSMNDVKFVGAHTLTITSANEGHYTLDVTYDFGTKIKDDAGRIFQVSNFVLENASLNVVQLDDKKTIDDNQPGGSVFGEAQVTVQGKSTMTITTNEYANRVFYNNNSSMSIIGENAKVILNNASSLTASLSMTNGATLEINNPIGTAGNFYPNISNTGKECKITVTGAADGNHGLFFYGSVSNAEGAAAVVLKNCAVKTDGIVGIYGSNNVIDATGTTIEADSIVAVNATKSFGETPVYFDAAGISNATLKVNKVSSPIMSWYTDSVGTKTLKLEGVTFVGDINLDSAANVTLSNLKSDIVVKGKVGNLKVVGGQYKVNIQLDEVKSLLVENTKDVTIDGGVFGTSASHATYVKDNNNRGQSVINIAGIDGTVTIRGVNIYADEAYDEEKGLKGQGISITRSEKVTSIVINNNTVTNTAHHSLMIGQINKDMTTLTISGNTFSNWGQHFAYSSAIHMFGSGDSAKSNVDATISNNTFTCVMEDTTRLGKIVSIGFQNGNKADGTHESMIAFNEPVSFAGNKVNGAVKNELKLTVGMGTTYVDYGTLYKGGDHDGNKAGIAHAAISYGDLTIVKNGVMDITSVGSIQINGTVTCEGIIRTTDTVKIVANPGTLIMMPGSELEVVNGESMVDVIGTNGVNVKSGSISINTIGSDPSVGFGAVIEGVSEVKDLSVWGNDKLIVNKDAELKVTGVLNVFQTEKLIVNGKITITDVGKLTVRDQSIVGKDSAFVLGSGASVAINTNANGGYDAILSGKATSTGYTIKAKDTLTIANGAELKMTGDLTIIGKLIVDGTLDLGESKLILEDTTTVDVKGKITGGEIDIANIANSVKCIAVNVNGVLNTTVDGTVKEGTKDIKSIVVLDNVIAGANGITVKKGSVIVDGIIKTGDVTIPAGSTSFVYGTLESGSTLTIEPTASVNPETTGHSGTLVVESGASVVSEGAIVSVIYKAGSSYNGEEFSKDTKITPSGEVKVSIRIYLNYDSNKLYVSEPYVDAFAGDKYGDLLSDVYVEGVNKRITFTGWYNTLNEKIVGGAIVPDVTGDIILSAHFDEVAKQIPAKVDSDNGNGVNDYSLVIAIIVLVASVGFLAYVIKKR